MSLAVGAGLGFYVAQSSVKLSWALEQRGHMVIAAALLRQFRIWKSELVCEMNLGLQCI